MAPLAAAGGAELCPPLGQPAWPELCPPRGLLPHTRASCPSSVMARKKEWKLIPSPDQNLGFRGLIPHAFVDGVRNCRAEGKISPLYSPAHLQYWDQWEEAATGRKEKQSRGTWRWLGPWKPILPGAFLCCLSGSRGLRRGACDGKHARARRFPCVTLQQLPKPERRSHRWVAKASPALEARKPRHRAGR